MKRYYKFFGDYEENQDIDDNFFDDIVDMNKYCNKKKKSRINNKSLIMIISSLLILPLFITFIKKL